MELTILGSGTVAPTPDRTSPAHWIDVADVRLLLDCGAGVLHHAAVLGVPWHQVTHIAITHFHQDHWGELPAYLFALRWGTLPARSAPLTLIGPRGFGVRLEALAAAYGEWVTAPEFSLDVVEIDPLGTIELAPGVTFECCKTPHTPESLAYAVRHGGARLVYTGDTGESEELAAWARGCDLLLAECSLPDRHAVELHLTPQRVGRLAQRAEARRLVLTHLYPVFGDTDPVAETAQVYDGDVVVARDGDRFTIEAG